MRPAKEIIEMAFSDWRDVHTLCRIVALKGKGLGTERPADNCLEMS